MAAQEVFNQRLDAVDRALLGVLPRTERLAVVADIETRLRESGCVEPTETTEEAPAAGEVVGAARRSSGRRSRLALTSGIVGIIAVAMLVATPLVYLLVAVLGEVMGEEIAYGMIALSILALASCGVAAVIMGITALVRLGRRRGVIGHGWAITGLCTGPMPALVGMLGLVTFVLPLTMELVDASTVSAPAVDSAQAVYASDVPKVLPAAGTPYPPTTNSAYACEPIASSPTVHTAALPPLPSSGAPAVAPRGYGVPATTTGEPAFSSSPATTEPTPLPSLPAPAVAPVSTDPTKPSSEPSLSPAPPAGE